ncbi:MAG: catalase family peroxidase [Thermoleophilaceae bacterium]|nr:catalase family peroxidase [Thermoleophilaceae bacterium]
MDEFAEQVVDAINDLTGRHPGHRAAHAKGTLVAGSFIPADAGLTTAPHMSGEPVAVTIRFSNGGGNPDLPDYAQEGRGMAIKFYLPDGSRTDVVALDQPCFFARTPEDFFAFTQVRKPDPETGQPDMEKVGAYLGEHPEAVPAIQFFLQSKPPESYVTRAYNSIHSFRWTNADGVSRWVRYRFEPESGEHSLEPEEAKERGADYLQEDLAGRGGAAFRMLVVIAEDGDPVDDPTVEWPAERRRVEVGRLELTGPETGREKDGDVLVFDPVRVTDGIETSDDPILHFRSRAYRVSVGRRTAAAPV